MATVVNTKAKYLQFFGQNGEPNIYLESEGDKYIKELAYKQSDTDLTLEKHLQQEKEFQPTFNYLSVTEFSAGPSSLHEFVLKTHKTEQAVPIEDTDEQNKNVENYENASNVSRHIQELALSVKPNSLETKLLHFAISCNKYRNNVDTRPANHPINNLTTIHNTLFANIFSPNPEITAKTVTRKRKQLLNSFSDPIGPIQKFNFREKERSSSLWDVTENTTNTNANKKSKRYTCTLQPPKKLYTIKDDVIVPLDSLSKESSTGRVSINSKHFVSSVLFNENCHTRPLKYSVDEIRQIPAFSNYQTGIPSKVLYLKNLPPTVNEDDLIDLFKHFEKSNKSRLIYRLMQKGRMRGQAFVTFSSIPDATEALNSINGIILKGKPIIIQFSNKSNPE